MKVRCPSCRGTFEIPDPETPREVRCRACGAALRVTPREGGKKPCPGCGKPVVADAALCVSCGYDLKAGAYLATSLDAEGEPEEQRDGEEAPSAPMRALMLVGEWMPGLLRPHIVVLSILVGIVGLGILAFGLALFATCALLTCFLAGAVGVIVYAQAIAWLLDGELCWLVEALTNFEGPRWALFFSLLILPMVIGFALMHFAMTAG